MCVPVLYRFLVFWYSADQWFGLGGRGRRISFDKEWCFYTHIGFYHTYFGFLWLVGRGAHYLGVGHIVR